MASLAISPALARTGEHVRTMGRFIFCLGQAADLHARAFWPMLMPALTKERLEMQHDR